MLSSPAQIVLFGGEAGGGKSFGLLLWAARHIATPGYSAVVFRRELEQIRGAGGLLEESGAIYPALGGRLNKSAMQWRFPTARAGRDAIIQFAGLQHEADVHKHQGKQYARIGFDEVTHLGEPQFWYLQSRNRSTSGVRPAIRATCNPDPDSFVRQLIGWWIGPDGYPLPERDGKLRWFVRAGRDLVWADTKDEAAKLAGAPLARARSLTFIRSRLSDNAILNATDPEYRAILDSLPEVERKRLGGGNWDVRAVAGDYFKIAWFPVIEPETAAPAKMRAWDLAATAPSEANPDPDYTVGVRGGFNRETKTLDVDDVVRDRLDPGDVEDLIKRTAARDGRGVIQMFWQDPAQAGKAQIRHLRKLLFGYPVDSIVERKDKATYWLPCSSAAKGGFVRVVNGAWAGPFLHDLEGVPRGKKDSADALSLLFMQLSESKLDRLRSLSRWAS